MHLKTLKAAIDSLISGHRQTEAQTINLTTLSPIEVIKMVVKLVLRRSVGEDDDKTGETPLYQLGLPYTGKRGT